MSMLGKSRLTDQQRPPGAAEALRPAAGATLRRSNGLKDFLWLIPEQPQGRVLDLGAVAQPTIAFFTDRNFRISAEDLMRSWTQFRLEREAHSNGSVAAEAPEPPDTALLVRGFLTDSLQFEPETFHGILAWDVFDFLDTELLAPTVARLHRLLALGGVLLAAFHDVPAAEPCQFRVRDHETLELQPTHRPQQSRRVLQNREILSLFGEFRSSRTFVGRDHLREALFLK